MKDCDRKILAYIIGIAIGDGNLSNPNGRAIRLRISCDAKYQNLIKRICFNIKKLLPNNKVSLVKRARTYLDISCYSNKWEDWLGWKSGQGSKYKQNISVPRWIKSGGKFSKECLRGLLETDGSIYKDRGYQMVNFVTIIPNLANDVMEMIRLIGFNPHLYKIKDKRNFRYNIRLSKSTKKFIEKINLKKD